jgi:hypothetical protein
MNYFDAEVVHQDVASRTLARHAVAGNSVRITFDMDQIHLFDKITEQAIHNP